MNQSRFVSLSCLSLLFAGCSVDVGTSPVPVTVAPSVMVPQPDIDPDDPRIKELSDLLRKRADAEEFSQENAGQIEEHLRLVLPTPEYIGVDKEWSVTCLDNLINLELKPKDGGTRLMWFHVLYEPEEKDSYGSEDFENYRGMGMTDKHYFILVGHLEIRAVADSDEYKDDAKIKNMLRAFALNAIEKL